jgi:hypothetical protein
VVVYQEVVLLIAEKESKILTGYTIGPVTTGAIFVGGITCVGVVTVVSVFLQEVKNTKKNKPKPHRTFFIGEVLR